MGRKGKKKVEVNQSFKSPNLEVERRRREKLHGRLMALRSHVPIITNMTNVSILEDAITYIKELQKEKENLLHKIEEEEETDMLSKPEHDETSDTNEEMKKLGIEENVQMCKIGERKYWLKMTLVKKAGIFTKLMEILFDAVDLEQTKDFLAQVMRSNP